MNGNTTQPRTDYDGLGDTRADTDHASPPPVLPFDPDGLADELKPQCQFVGWDWEWAKDKWTKVPKNPHTGGNADTTKRETCGTLAQAMAAAKRHNWAGVGFVFFRDDPYFGIDVDDDPDTAHALLARFPTFAELSVRQRGPHVIGKATRFPHDGSGKRRGSVEAYWHSRFFACTGAPLPGHHEITDCTEALAGWYAETFSPQSTPTTTVINQARSHPASTEETLRLARASKHGDEFAALYDRAEIALYSNDRSAADQALANRLAFWFGPDPAAIDRAFRGSALMRDKWDERHYSDGRTYGEGTIETALAGRTEFYTTPESRSASPPQRHTVPPVDPCHAERDQIAELRAEIASLRAENEQLRAERDQSRRDLSAVIKTLANPNLGGDAAGKAFVLAATEVQYQRHSRPSADDYCRVTATRVADNVHYVDGQPVTVPAQISPRTVTKYMDIAAKKKLIPAEKRTIQIPKGERDIPVDVWHWKAAPTLADQLAPLTTGSVYDDDNPRPLRGGDPNKRRRLKELPLCPECGGHHVACVSCGVMFEMPAAVDLDSGKTLTAAELAREHPADARHTVPPDEDVSVRYVEDVTNADKFVGRPEADGSHTVPPGGKRRLARAEADLATRYVVPPEPDSVERDLRPPTTPWLPGFDPPPPDRYTDIAHGARR